MAAPAKNKMDDNLTQKIENNLKPLENRSMSKNKKSASTNPEFASPYTVNKTLFEAATKIKNHLELIEKRLAKMEEHRSQVSESVYLKVKTDYETQIDEIRAQFESKCSEVESELRQLYQAKSRQEVELAKHQEILEEAKFRHTLGEFTDRKFKEVETKENKEINGFNKLLEVIQSSIGQYENILGHPYSVGENMENSTYESSPSAQELVEPADKAIAQTTADLADMENLDTEYTPALGALSSQAKTKKNNVPPPAPIQPQEKSENSLPSEASLESELDDLLESEGSAEDYFNEKNQETAKPKQPAAETQVASPTSANKIGDDPSISSILRDIPMDGPAAETKAVTPAENTTAPKAQSGGIPEASLLLIEGELDEPEITLSESLSIGRSPSNDLVLKESKISRQHATIHYREGAFWLVDLKSSNGVYVNDKRLEESALKDGDDVKIGSFKFQFSLL